MPKCPAQGYFSISLGIIGIPFICLLSNAFTIMPSFFNGANSTFLASSKLPIVAEIHQTEIFEFDEFFC